jgi:hypothetical protein
MQAPTRQQVARVEQMSVGVDGNAAVSGRLNGRRISWPKKIDVQLHYFDGNNKQ